VKGCRVCRLPASERKFVDVALALGRSPAWLSRRFLNVSRHQIKTHLERCLRGDAFLYQVRLRGWDDVIEAAIAFKVEQEEAS
jgi:hypothetical protein